MLLLVAGQTDSAKEHHAVQSSPEHSRVCLEATQRFWEERTGEHVSDEDAREAIRNVSAFIDLLAARGSAGVLRLGTGSRQRCRSAR